MRDEILQFVKDRGDNVTFAELARMPGAAGDFTFESGIRNLVIWHALSAPFCEALISLRDEKKIEFWPTSPLTYLADGAMLKLPIVKRRPPAKGYSKPRWLPLVVRLAR